MRRLPLIAAALLIPLAAPLTSLAQASKPALYTDAQATAGAAVYAQSCAACHGSQLEGVAAPAL
jgi:mono/diheme cytochrome c family protein